MARNLYLAIIILFVIGFLYIIKTARHHINMALLYLVILTLTMGLLTSFVFISDFQLTQDISGQYNLTPDSIKILLYTFSIITYVTIIQIPIKKLYNKDIEVIVPPPGDKGHRGNRGKSGDSGNCTKCGAGDLCYKKILYNVTLTYNWWRKHVKKLTLLPDSYIIKNEYLKAKIKNHCKSDEFSKILKKFGSNNKTHKNGAYDYMFRMWTIWILIILKYDKGQLFLESEQLTETDFVNMVGGDNSNNNEWKDMFTGSADSAEKGISVSIKKTNVDCDESDDSKIYIGLKKDFFMKTGVPTPDETPFDEIKKYSAWYWGSESNSKPIVEIRTGLDEVDDSNIKELCKTCGNGCTDSQWTSNPESNPKIKIKKTNTFYKLFSTDKAGQTKDTNTNTFTPFQKYGSENVTFLRPYEYIDNDEHPKFRNYKPIGDVLIHSSQLDNISDTEKCEPNELKYTRKNIKKIVSSDISSILVSGDVVHPESFELVYTSINRRGVNKNITAFSVWKPIITDTVNYVALGYVIDTTPYKINEQPKPPSTDIMVCVPVGSTNTDDPTLKSIWKSETKDLDGMDRDTRVYNSGEDDITLEKADDDSTQSYPLNTFRMDTDTTIKLEINLNSELECKEKDVVNTTHDPKNECTIITEPTLCNAHPKCEYDNDNDNAATTDKCNYKKTNIKDLLNYSILKIYK